MSRRLSILKSSLEKKEAKFNEKLQAHFDTVKQANGQPLNDKRNGKSTLDKWNKQSDALRNLEKSIQKQRMQLTGKKTKLRYLNQSHSRNTSGMQLKRD
ncbi:TPA: hypothetical protein OT071_003536 [Morganella morganii]|nr:hypothetical protein [Morganella morganii]